MVKRLLIIGDSFSASTSTEGWNNLIEHYQVENLSSCGSSEYRLIKILDQTNTDEFDKIIFVHTSPYRIYVKENPYYVNSNTHKKCDLLYADVKSYLPDEFAQHVSWWFEHVFDLDQAKFVHERLVDYAIQKIPQSLHLTFFDYNHANVFNLHKIWKNNPGDINHMNTRGNQQVIDFVNQHL
jgi:hypothetical protein